MYKQQAMRERKYSTRANMHVNRKRSAVCCVKKKKKKRK